MGRGMTGHARNSTPWRAIDCEEFTPASWIRGPHAQSVMSSVGRRVARFESTLQRVELSDGDFVDVERFAGARPDAPLLVICHGLEGSSRATYVRGLVGEAAVLGFACAAVNFRGCSGVPNRLPRLYHSGVSDDLAQVVEHLAGEMPGRAIALAGFSLGGNVTVKYLAERGSHAPAEVCGAAVVSVPFDLAACAEVIDGPGFWIRVYRTRFLRGLRRKAREKASQFPHVIDAAAVDAARTITHFDEYVTAPLHGFASAADYYARCSSGPLLSSVRHTLLIIAALDDPMVPARSLPLELAGGNPHITLVTPAAGGHVGFVSGPPWRPVFWAERRAARFLADAVAPDRPAD
jgi:uncharacterized protein